MKSLRNLVVYRGIIKSDIIKKYIEISEGLPCPEAQEKYCEFQNMLLEYYGGYAEEDLWKKYLHQVTCEDENSFSNLCENRICIWDGLYELVVNDMNILLENANFNFNEFEQKIHMQGVTLNSVIKKKSEYWKDGAVSTAEYFKNFYTENGTGIFQSSHVFKITDNGNIKVVANYDKIQFKDLIGYERQIKALKENTELLLRGQRSNNVLLYGDRGTGKSSSVKALLNEYKDMGLRVIEMKKNQFRVFPAIIDAVRNKKHKFIVFIDDLSFEEHETEYKILKAVLEGSFESKPDNLLIYVTSNRRHLIKEKFSERDADIHGNETVSEKLSLFDRFGITIYYNQPNDDLYNNMVKTMAKKTKIDMPEEELMKLANEWKIAKASKSGRSARQLIDKLVKK